MSMSRTLLTSREACAILRIDRSTLSRWVRAGKVRPAMKLPGTRGASLFTPRAIERLLPPDGDPAGGSPVGVDR